MKKLLLILLCLPMIGFGQNVNIPDANFKAYLVGEPLINTNGDTEIQVSEAANFSGSIPSFNSLDFSNITDVTGIEYFTSLTGFYFFGSQITTLNLNNNSNLQHVWVANNLYLASLDLTGADSLISLNCSNNSLTSLDLSDAPALTWLDCRSNQLTSLDIRNGNNMNMTSINAIANYDLYCIDVDSGANLAANTFYFDSWSSLSNECLLETPGCMDSTDINYDPLATVNDGSCNYDDYTIIPDPEFEAYLESNGMGDGIIGNDSVLTININTVTQLSIVHCSALNLIGIEDFTALTFLSIENSSSASPSQLTTIDLSNNIKLNELRCSYTSLASLDLNYNVSLKELYVSSNQQLTMINLNTDSLTYVNVYNNNQLTSLDVSGNTNLWTLFCIKNDLLTTLNISNTDSLFQLKCYENQLQNLDVNTNSNLKYLDCYDNQLTSLDVSNNPNLTRLKCFSNQLELDSLNVTGADSLTILECYDNQLTFLDVSSNSILANLHCYDNELDSLNLNGADALTILECYDNQLTFLDVSSNSILTNLHCYANELDSLNLIGADSLTIIECYSNQLTSLDVSSNSILTNLHCYANELDSLNVTGADALTTLECYENQLTSLDVSSNTALISLNCRNNQLNSLDLRNGNNVNISVSLDSLNLTNNAQLYCIDVDDAAYSTTNWTVANGNISYWNSFSNSCDTANYGCTDLLAYNYDSSAIINYGCDYGTTYVPDANFENYLETHTTFGAVVAIGSPSSMGNGIPNDSMVPTANIKFVTNLMLYGQSISDITGLEDFDSLQTLNCGANPLTSLDVSSNSNLKSLNCYNFLNLDTLDLSQNANLTWVQCHNSGINTLILNGATALTTLRCYGNQLTTLEVNTNLYLTELWCQDNQLTTLDISSNDSLTSLRCYGNQLTSLDLGGSSALEDVWCYDNNLTSLYLNNAPDLYRLWCHDNDLDTLEVSTIPNLTYLKCYSNDLTYLNLSQNTSLLQLDCDDNELEYLNLDNLTNFRYLECSNNQLTSLDLSSNINLRRLMCDSNQLTSLDLRNGWSTNYNGSYPNVYLLYNNLNLTNNPQLYCINVDSAAYSTANWTVANGNIDSTMSFSTNCATAFGCTDSLACNYDSTVTIDDNSCLTAYGCTDNTACNYDALATCDDGSCLSAYGCMDASACNYDASATCDDGSCDLPNGCGDALYLEYDANVTCSDVNACVTLIVNGCTDNTACNYNASANVDDGSCLTAYGCVDALACNYDVTATCDDSSCVYQSLSIDSVGDYCDTYTWIDGATYTTSNNTATYIVTNAVGCDSIITLDLNITGNPISIITQNGTDLEVTIADTYNWNTSATTQTITPTVNGWYWCIITDVNGCISDTATYEVTNIVSAIN